MIGKKLFPFIGIQVFSAEGGNESRASLGEIFQRILRTGTNARSSSVLLFFFFLNFCDARFLDDALFVGVATTTAARALGKKKCSFHDSAQDPTSSLSTAQP